MENKIKIRVEEEQILRLSIPTSEGVVVVNNPSEKYKNELLNKLVECIVNSEDIDERKIMLDLINHCTNVELVGDIFEAQYLSHEVKMIVNEVLIIFQELTEEVYQIVKLVVQQAKNEVTQEEILKEKNDIVNKIEKMNEEKQEKVNEKANVQSMNKKRPQRGRRKI